MPITKRHLYDSYLYGPPDIYEESTSSTILQDIAMSQTLGTLHQLRYLAMYSVEIFDNLARLSIDLSDRIQMVTIKTNILLTKIPAVEKKVRSTDFLQVPKKKKTKKFRSREPYIPSILTKNTNSSQIRSQYTFCNIMPQLWKMETVVPDDCVIKYSHPGLFFEEWLKVEILKQDELRKEKKKAKEERRKLRDEKRKKRLEEDEKQAATMSARDRAKARARQLKEEKRKEKERVAKEAEENRRRVAASRPTLTPSSLEQLPSAPPSSSPPSAPSKPTTIPPTPQEPKPRYPPDSIANMPSTLPPAPKEKPPRYPPDSPPPSEKKSRKPNTPGDNKEKALERNSSSSLPRSRAPTFDDLDLPPDDLPPPDDEVPPPDDDLPPPDDDLPPDDDFPPLDDAPPLDDFPSPDGDEPPSDDLEPPPPISPPLSPKITRIPSMPSPPRRPSSPPPMVIQPEPTHVPLPPKPAPKARRKSLLDIKADKKAVIAAATENLKSLNQRVDMEGERESEEFKESDLLRESIQSFSRPFSKKPDDDHESGRDSPPAIEYSLPPRRASIRIPSSHPPEGINQRLSSVDKRPSLSQETPLTASELKRGTRNSTITPFMTADDDHAMYAATSANAAQETIEAMSSLLDHSNRQQEEVWQEELQHSQEYQYQDGDYQNYGNNEYYDPNYYDPNNQYYEGDQSYYYTPETALEELPPMEEQPVQVRQLSSLAIFSGGSILGDIRSGKVLRKAAPPPPKERSARETSLDLIKSGGVQLKRAEPIATKKAPEQRSGAIAAILSNRAQIAGSDSDSDSSDSDFSDDDIF